MNRTIALFVGLAVLLAHTLTIHDTIDDEFGPPYELAHVAFRISRNLVYGDGLSWSPGHAGFDAYPSPLWIAITALGQRFYLGVNYFSQVVGIVCALSTAVAVSWFRRERAAGLIAALLLVVNGAQAAAAASGTENALFTLSAIFSFLCLEKRWRKRLALVLVVLCATRPEGVVFVGAFGILALLQDRDEPLVKRLAPFVPVATWLVLIAALRHASNGSWLSPTGFDLFAVTAERTWRGLSFVWLFARCQVTPLLALLPLALLLTGRLSEFGVRCLFLAALWTAVVVARGGLSQPFAQVMLPALPFLFLAIQAAMCVVLDYVGWVRKLALTALAISLLLSGLASRTPSDFGPIPIARFYTSWFGEGSPSQYQSRGHMGRLGLAKEIQDTGRLRNIALFFRDHLEPSDSVLTPWPGSAGNLSRLDIVDLLGRTHRWPGQERLGPWLGVPRADIAVALESRPDYIMFARTPLAQAPTINALAHSWVGELDTKSSEVGRVEQVSALFDGYVAVAVPVGGLGGPESHESYFYFLLRRLDLARRPRVQVAVKDGRFVVEVRHSSHEQICDLRLTLVDETGRSWPIDPLGKAHSEPHVVARSGIELYSSDRPFRMIEGPLPVLPPEAEGARAVELRAVLANPGTPPNHEFAKVSEEAFVPLP